MLLRHMMLFDIGLDAWQPFRAPAEFGQGVLGHGPWVLDRFGRGHQVPLIEDATMELGERVRHDHPKRLQDAFAVGFAF